MQKKKLSIVLMLVLVLALVTACGSSEGNDKKQESNTLTADLITYDGVLDNTNLYDGEAVVIRASSDLTYIPSLMCYEVFGSTKALQEKAAISENTYEINLIIDNKTDKTLYPIAHANSLVVNGRSIADERFAILTVNTDFSSIFVTSEENVDPSSSSGMYFFFLTDEELLPELTGLDYVDTIEFAIDLCDENKNVVDTVNVSIKASRPLTEEEIAAKNAPPENMDVKSFDGIVDIGVSLNLNRFNPTENSAWGIADLSIKNVGKQKCMISIDPIIINDMKNIEGVTYDIEVGETVSEPLFISGEEFKQLGISTQDEIKTILAHIEIRLYDAEKETYRLPVVNIDDYKLY